MTRDEKIERIQNLKEAERCDWLCEVSEVQIEIMNDGKDYTMVDYNCREADGSPVVIDNAGMFDVLMWLEESISESEALMFIYLHNEEHGEMGDGTFELRW